MGKFLYVRGSVGTHATVTVSGTSSLPAFTLTSVATGTAANDLSVDIEFGDEIGIAYADNTITITVVQNFTTAGEIDALWGTSPAAPIATFAVAGSSVAFPTASQNDFTGGLDEKRLGFNVDHLKQIQAQTDSEIKLIIAEDHQSSIGAGADTTEIVLNISENEHAQVVAKIADFCNAPRLNFAVLADDVLNDFLAPQIVSVKSITY